MNDAEGARPAHLPAHAGSWSLGLRNVRLLAVAMLLTFAMLTLPGGGDAQASPCGGATASRVQVAARAFLAAARSGSRVAFGRAVRQHLAIRRIALFALGRHARRMSRADKNRYVKLATNYIARQLANHSSSFRNAQVRIVACRGNLVEGRILPRGSRIMWRLARGRIVDVYMDGIWLAPALRSHFAGMLQRADGDMGRFMAMLD